MVVVIALNLLLIFACDGTGLSEKRSWMEL